ncbi:hypothetical protein H310_10468 [Aphanomyces invadans]|uniref:FAD dependent oxidoreductase domain-containing protein n=1 Tax=Aphanomyces invadans TaxID=157072 RepID=A0A024TQJ6_9STRA|nr:hypothetical protein H310_10468 [Aphanomyces invadans]ETV96303.1 hypothetical protein H310_10468 [Aphanomyces invadans]|eukprot:XP_008875095.1 hypothetical protein H310_10468 [Aphanomyces invadans]
MKDETLVMTMFDFSAWGHETMMWLQGLLDTHGSAAVGVKKTQGTELQDTPTLAHPYWAHSVDGFRFLAPDEAKKYGHAFGFEYTSLMIHPGVLMAWMTKQIQSRGGTFEKRHLSSLENLRGDACDVIVNCTGLGAGKLVNDPTVYPVRGQVVKVFNRAINQFFLVESGGHYTYILPRPGGEVILGGTVQAHNWSTDCNDDDVKDIVERCAALDPAVKESRVLETKAGLRPSTTRGTRVELDPKRGAGTAWIIHNYGHGGSGHTIHRGCAADVARIVESLAAKL